MICYLNFHFRCCSFDVVWKALCVASVLWEIHFVSSYNTECSHHWCFLN